MRYEVAQVLTEPRISQARRLYNAAFAPLRSTAAQRHVMHDWEFDQVMTDVRVDKHMAVDPKRDLLVGLATFTNNLEAMPLISPEFFERRWPSLYRERKVWYLGFFATDPEYRRKGIFEGVIAQMWAEIQRGGGVAALDMCGYNNDLGLAAAIQRTLTSLSPAMRTEQVDVQTYWSFTLDTPG